MCATEIKLRCNHDNWGTVHSLQNVKGVYRMTSWIQFSAHKRKYSHKQTVSHLFHCRSFSSLWLQLDERGLQCKWSEHMIQIWLPQKHSTEYSPILADVKVWFVRLWHVIWLLESVSQATVDTDTLQSVLHGMEGMLAFMVVSGTWTSMVFCLWWNERIG